MSRRPTFIDAVLSRYVRLPDGREGRLFSCPSSGYGRGMADVEIGDQLVTVRVDDLEVIR